MSGRGRQLAAGAERACGDWLLFLHADTTLEEGWKHAIDAYIADPANQNRAAAFRCALDDGSAEARRLERMVASRAETLALPYGDQGLFIKRDFYGSLGGFRALPLMEDVDLIRRIRQRRLVVCRSKRGPPPRVGERKAGWRAALHVAVSFALLLGVPRRLLLRLYH